MARKSYPSAPMMDKSYQTDDDCHTLTRAAEVISDRTRHKAALRRMSEKHRDTGKMINVLSNMRMGKGSRRG